MNAARHIAPIDGLRGVAVLLVILFHWMVVRDAGAGDAWIAAITAIEPLNRLVRHGYLGVDLFFVISGFLLAMPWWLQASRGLPSPPIAEYYRRRARRIVPAYYVQLVLLFVVVLPLLRGAGYWRSDLYVYALNALLHGTFLHNLTPLTSASMGVNGALWSLAVEAQFYLLLPFAMPLFVRRPAVMLAACLLATLAWRLRLESDFLRAQLPAYLAHFALGIVAARAWLQRSEKAPRKDGALQALLGRGPLAWVGLVSYSAYLYHLPLLYLWNRYVPLGGWASLPLYLVAVFLLAWSSWRFIERRFHPGVRGQTPITRIWGLTPNSGGSASRR